MRQFLITLAGVLAGLILFSIAVPVILVIWLGAVARPAPLPDRVVLDLDLRGALTDQPSANPLAALRGSGLSVIGVERTLRRASGDPKVGALLVRLPEGGMAPAVADELALAFHRFRAAGKPILAFSQGLFQDGAVVSTYRLAAASGNIWMQAGAPFQVSGLSRAELFFKRFFDRHAISADFQQRAQYKTAVNPLIYSDYTSAHRESELSWMGSVYDADLAAAAADRSMDAGRLRRLIEAAPYSAENARAAGLIDATADGRAAEKAILAKAGDD
ncbi:MAG: S49 family peptidase, partial [Caulobacteraceae bacterium]